MGTRQCHKPTRRNGHGTGLPVRRIVVPRICVQKLKIPGLSKRFLSQSQEFPWDNPGILNFLEKHDLLMKSVSSTHKGHSFLPSEMRQFNTIKRRQSNTRALVQQKSLSSTQMRQFHTKASVPQKSSL